MAGKLLGHENDLIDCAAANCFARDLGRRRPYAPGMTAGRPNAATNCGFRKSMRATMESSWVNERAEGSDRRRYRDVREPPGQCSTGRGTGPERPGINPAKRAKGRSRCADETSTRFATPTSALRRL